MIHSVPELENELTFSPHGRFLKKHGLYSAALYYKNLNETLELRAARAGSFALEHGELPSWQQGQLVPIPCGCSLFGGVSWDDPQGWGLKFQQDGEAIYHGERLKGLLDKCENSAERYTVELVMKDMGSMFGSVHQFRYFHLGIHNVVDFQTLMDKGLGSREQEIALAKASPEPGKRMFAQAMELMLRAAERFVSRYRIFLLEQPDPWARRIGRALEQVPMGPPRSFFEAWVSCGMAMALAGCFEPGRIDQYLLPWYLEDLAAGKTDREEAYRLLRATFEDIDRGVGHPGVTHVTVGGTDRQGKSAYNALTELSLRAIRGLRTPNLTLRVRRDMPQDLWQLCLENIGMGCAQPALVNEELFLEKLQQDYDIPFGDAVEYVFGGCSELLIQGKTMCDSTWVQYNMLDIFEHTLYNHFLTCDSFEAFYEQFRQDVALTLKDLERQINVRQLALAMNMPMLMKSLFTDGCIRSGRSFTDGGAPYNFDATNIYASTNTINSLYALRYFYEGKLGAVTKEQLLTALVNNFRDCPELRARCQNVPKFGNYDPRLNALAHDLMRFTFRQVMELRCWRGGGRFMPAIILWISWISSGLRVGATPDGRLLGEPTAASCGPVPGTDTEGPTAVMGAALSLEQGNCAGTCVLNLRLDGSNFRTPERTEKVRTLLQVYFSRGGSQLQINVVDSARLRKALEDPRNHRDIIVRVGGFCDNFVLLDEKIQQQILRRTEHGI